MLSATPAQTPEHQAEKTLDRACQGSCFRAEKMPVLGKAPIDRCAPGEEIPLDTNV